MTKRGSYSIKSTKQVYKNPWIEVREDAVIGPDGKDGIFGVVTMVPGLSVVPLDDEGNIYMIEQYKYGVDRDVIELPTGGVDAGETDLVAAQRELLEETGFVADEWIPLGVVDPFTTVIVSPAHLFLARNLKEKGKPEDQTKIIKIPFATAIQWIMENKITHAQTCVAIFKVAEYLKKDSNPK